MNVNIAPKMCFCKYDVRELLPIAERKFHGHVSTLELMKAARSEEERDRVAIVAMLDLDDATCERVLADKLPSSDCHVLSCRRMLRNVLEKMMSPSA